MHSLSTSAVLDDSVRSDPLILTIFKGRIKSLVQIAQKVLWCGFVKIVCRPWVQMMWAVRDYGGVAIRSGRWHGESHSKKEIISSDSRD
jgi:hypothetical protein